MLHYQEHNIHITISDKSEVELLLYILFPPAPLPKVVAPVGATVPDTKGDVIYAQATG